MKFSSVFHIFILAFTAQPLSFLLLHLFEIITHPFFFFCSDFLTCTAIAELRTWLESRYQGEMQRLLNQISIANAFTTLLLLLSLWASTETAKELEKSSAAIFVPLIHYLYYFYLTSSWNLFNTIADQTDGHICQKLDLPATCTERNKCC